MAGQDLPAAPGFESCAAYEARHARGRGEAVHRGGGDGLALLRAEAVEPPTRRELRRVRVGGRLLLLLRAHSLALLRAKGVQAAHLCLDARCGLEHAAGSPRGRSSNRWPQFGPVWEGQL